MPHECTDCGRAFEDGSKEMLSGCPNCGGTTFQFRPEGTDHPVETDEPPEPPEAEVDGVARTVGNAASAVRDLVTGGRGSATTEPEDPGPGTMSSRDAVAGVSDETGQQVEAAPSSPDADESDTDDPEMTPPSGPEWPGEHGETDDGGQTAPASPDSANGESAGADEGDDIFEAEDIPSDFDRSRDRPPVPDPRPLSARSADETEPEDGEQADTATGLATGDPDERPSLSELRAELNDQFESIRVVEPGQYELNLMELYDREEYIIALQEDGKYTIQLPERWEER